MRSVRTGSGNGQKNRLCIWFAAVGPGMSQANRDSFGTIRSSSCPPGSGSERRPRRGSSQWHNSCT